MKEAWFIGYGVGWGTYIILEKLAIFDERPVYNYLAREEDTECMPLCFMYCNSYAK